MREYLEMKKMIPIWFAYKNDEIEKKGVGRNSKNTTLTRITKGFISIIFSLPTNKMQFPRKHHDNFRSDF